MMPCRAGCVMRCWPCEEKQLRGISPGFQVARGGEHLEREDPSAGDSMVRVIDDAVVFEYSVGRTAGVCGDRRGRTI